MSSCYFHESAENVNRCHHCRRNVCHLDIVHYRRHVEHGISTMGGQGNRGYHQDFVLCPVCYVTFLKDDNTGSVFYLFAIPLVLSILYFGDYLLPLLIGKEAYGSRIAFFVFLIPGILVITRRVLQLRKIQRAKIVCDKLLDAVELGAAIA